MVWVVGGSYSWPFSSTMNHRAWHGSPVSMQLEEDWEGFWRSTREAAAYRSGAPQQAALEQFWGGFFKRTLPLFPGARILDLACGNGVVARSALESVRTAGLPPVMACGLDRSPSALADLRRRLPAAFAVNGDALKVPFRDGVFAIVTSQFGAEYAGLGAVAEAARLVAPGGVLAAILHLKGGGIYNECQNNLLAMQALEQSSYLLHARAAFPGRKKPSSKRPGSLLGDRPTADFHTAGKAVLEILKRHGEGVAGGVVRRLHTDITRMYTNRKSIELNAILAWIDGMSSEFQTYAGRMAAMLAAALDENDLAEVMRQLTACSMVVRVHEVMHMGEAHEPAAWVLICDRHQGHGQPPGADNACQNSSVN